MRENLDKLEEEREKAHLKAERYKNQVKVAYDRRVVGRRFEVGDLV